MTSTPKSLESVGRQLLDSKRRLPGLKLIGPAPGFTDRGDQRSPHVQPRPRPLRVAWPGVSVRQTTGGGPKLLGIIKHGIRYLRKLVIQGAKAALPSLARTATAAR